VKLGRRWRSGERPVDGPVCIAVAARP